MKIMVNRRMYPVMFPIDVTRLFLTGLVSGRPYEILVALVHEASGVVPRKSNAIVSSICSLHNYSITFIRIQSLRVFDIRV